ncbi:CHAT domain-containing protein [uncultured Dokdonia sp.]|uniref:CHAT domain-containing protein n=1 Tax=uncultured Dokdonia sp. TaxID=575653 RepID=UPI002620E8A7|nr:CHAT domain-containing protein [uncultured Dokdonia sp.]
MINNFIDYQLKKGFSILCLIFISTYTLYSQEDVYLKIKSLSISDSLISQKLDSLLLKNIRESNFDDFSIVSNRYASWLYNRKRVSKSLETLNLSIKHHKGDTISLYEKHFKLGVYLYNTGHVQESLQVYETIIKSSNEDINSVIANAYIEIGRIYRKKGDLQTAIRHYQVAETILLKLNEPDKLLRCYIGFYNTYKDFDVNKVKEQMLKCLLKADSITNVYPVSYTRNYSIKRALGSYYGNYAIKDTIQGLLYLNKALELATKRKDSTRIAQIYANLGLLFDISNNKKALYYNELALKFSKQQKKKAIIYENLGLNNALLGNTNIAINQLHTALELLTGSNFKIITKEQQSTILNENYNDSNLWIMLGNLSEAYLLAYEKNKHREYLKESIKYALITDDLIDIYHKNSQEEASKLIWRKKVTEVYSRALRACFLYNDTEIGLQFMEKNKALLLYEENISRKEKQNLNLSDFLIQKELQIKKEIKELDQNENIKIIKLRNTLTHLEDSIKSIYPNYVKTLKPYQPLSNEYIQNSLKSDQVLIEYHINIDTGFGIYPNQNKGYIIFITKNNSHIFEMKNIDSLRKQIQQLSKSNSHPFRNHDELTIYNTLSNEIFKQLFPKEIRSQLKNKELIIIPDDFLTRIPFESLVISKGNNDSQYLIHQNQINYKYSYTFHEENKNIVNTIPRKQNMVALAPVNFDNQNLLSLKNSSIEIDNISAYFDATLYRNDKATKNTFSNSLGKYDIIHLATHANANDSITPWIAFSDEKINLDELSLYQNDASLVVLSACNTGTGKIVKGEGTMSLARGFFYGGAQTTVSSLWRVDDKSTTDIMTNFYKNISEGKSKSLALHDAKLNYLKNHKGSEVSPYYWSSFILIGDTNPLPKESNFLYYVAISLILIIGGLMFYLRRKR